MLQHEIFHGDTRGLLNAYQFGAKSNAAVVAAVLSSSGIKDSAAAAWQQQQLVQSPLNSEGSTSATPPECSTSSVSKENCTGLTAQAQSSVWSDYLNGGSFMGDNNVIPTSSSGAWWSTRDQELQQWNNFTLPQSQGGQAAQASQASQASPMSEMDAGEWSPSQLGCLTTAPEVNEQLSKMAIESNDYSSINTALVESEISNNPGSWSSILMGTAGNEDSTLENTSVEGLHEALFSKSFRTDSLSESNIKKAHGSPSWEFPLKGTGFEVDDMNNMNSKLGSHELQFSLGSHDERLSARMELDNWNHMMNESQHRAGTSSYSLDAFGNAAMDLQRQFDPSKIKQEIDVFYSNSNSSPIIGSMQQGLGGDNFKSSSMTDLLGASKPLMDSGGMSNLNIPQMLPSGEVSSRWGSRLPAMLAQVLPSNSPKQANLFGTNMVMSRPFMNYTPKQEHFKVQRMSTEQSSMSQQSSITSQHSDSHASKHMLQMDEGREVSSSPKRSLSSLPNTDHASEPFFKRPRIEQQSPTLPFKVRKEKLGERITALQQLVAPFGKTDTASVLLEAIGYIKFLHEQVQVLSTPYMKNTPTATARQNEPGKGSSSWSSSSDTKSNKDGDEPRQDLRSRGLCLVPISCTLQVANDNGADFWTPTIGGSSAK